MKANKSSCYQSPLLGILISPHERIFFIHSPFESKLCCFIYVLSLLRSLPLATSSIQPWMIKQKKGGESTWIVIITITLEALQVLLMWTVNISRASEETEKKLFSPSFESKRNKRLWMEWNMYNKCFCRLPLPHVNCQIRCVAFKVWKLYVL